MNILQSLLHINQVKFMNISTYKECAAFINEYVSDEELRELIFGEKIVNFKFIKKSAPIYRVMLCSFSLIYLKWLSCTRQEIKKYLSKHSKNVFYVLEELYKSEQLNPDIMIYVLTEAQKDVVENQKNSFFTGIISNDNFCAYSKLYELAYKCPNRNQADEESDSILLQQLVNVIKNSVWLESVEYKSQENKFVINGQEISCRDMIISHGIDNAKYILVDRSYISDKVKKVYMSFFGFNRLITIGGEII